MRPNASLADRSEVRYRGLAAAALGLVLLAGAAVRLLPWPSVFTPQGVRFTVDTDPHYHVLRAFRALADWPRVPWRDPWLDFPEGADILWPPLFDAVVAMSAWVAGGGHPSPETVERVAAVVPVALGVAALPLVALLGSALLGGGPWLDAALILALLPVSARFGMLGRTDQHVAEVLLFCWILLAFTRAWRAERARWSLAMLGLGLALAFWNWQGSALDLAVMALVVGGWHLFASPGDPVVPRMGRALALGSALAAALLAASVAALAPGGLRRFSLSGVGAFHAVLCGLSALFGGAILLARRRWPNASAMGRVASLAAGGLASALPLAIPALREPLWQGLTALARTDAWHSTISEFMSFFGQYSLSEELPYRFAQTGLTLLAAPLAAIPMARAWRHRPEERPALFALAAPLALFLFLTVTRVRFGLYLAPLLAVGSAYAVRALAGLVAGRLTCQAGWIGPALAGAGALLVSVPLPWHLLEGLSPEGLGSDEAVVATLQRLRWQPPARADRPAVLARWPLGHLVQYYAGKPVVTSPFGSDAGPRSLEDWGAFAFDADEARVEALLSRREVGFLILDNPMEAAKLDAAFAPPGTPPLTPETVEDLVAGRLFFFDGSQRPDRAERGLGHFRLLLVSPGFLKVFGWVPGCHVALRGARPRATVRLSARVTPNRGRGFTWTSAVEADPAGSAQFLLPYATGQNGEAQATPYDVTQGGMHGLLSVTEECVVAGMTSAVDVAPQPPR